MTIHLSKEVENAIKAAVRSGRYASADEMIARLVQDEARRREEPKQPRTSRKETNRARTVTRAAEPDKPKMVEELHRRWMASGLITQLPDPAQDVNDDDPEDQPVVIKGEPLSETILRQRR
jgi:Arc/MetJ-type ribon-helix-helix transcriptional regulator